MSDLRTIAGLNGLTVTKLALRARKSRNTLYRAWKRPDQYGPTYRKMEKLLPRRTP